MKIIILITLILSNSVFAQNSAPIKKGDKAPFSGIILTKERAEKALKAEKANIVLKDLRIAQDDLIDYHKADAKKQRERLSEAKFDSFLSNTGYFILGAVLTALTFKINEKVGDL